MPANPVPIDVKTKGQTWLLPPYNWSHRRIAKELDVSPSVVSKWRNELVESGLLSTELPLENATTDYSAELTSSHSFAVKASRVKIYVQLFQRHLPNNWINQQSA